MSGQIRISPEQMRSRAAVVNVNALVFLVMKHII